MFLSYLAFVEEYSVKTPSSFKCDNLFISCCNEISKNRFQWKYAVSFMPFKSDLYAVESILQNYMI